MHEFERRLMKVDGWLFSREPSNQNRVPKELTLRLGSRNYAEFNDFARKRFARAAKMGTRIADYEVVVGPFRKFRITPQAG